MGKFKYIIAFLVAVGFGLGVHFSVNAGTSKTYNVWIVSEIDKPEYIGFERTSDNSAIVLQAAGVGKPRQVISGARAVEKVTAWRAKSSTKDVSYAAIDGRVSRFSFLDNKSMILDVDSNLPKQDNFVVVKDASPAATTSYASQVTEMTERDRATLLDFVSR